MLILTLFYAHFSCGAHCWLLHSLDARIEFQKLCLYLIRSRRLSFFLSLLLSFPSKDRKKRFHFFHRIHTHTHTFGALLNRQPNDRRPLSHSIFDVNMCPAKDVLKQVKEWKIDRQNGFSIGIFHANGEKLATESRFLVFDFVPFSVRNVSRSRHRVDSRIV